ncbi:UDP-glucose dehydrogenase family protein [Salsuginibacillus kocurii]|uniref:UDP-glucose dehydrogenase family protein n=1 Tax=Salsuginibacillus kocurii TaxID=427078 RepID=UPI00037CF609|nr:UDP-glucose/GDP-mannose dehydrogenase family protein [Salsuginibacillus kocurii]
MKILFIGMGYVGTTMAVVLANAGHEVTGLDVDNDKISSLQKGELYFHEPGLQTMLMTQLQNKNLTFTSDPKEAVETNDVLFITVGTPSQQDGNADLTYVKKAAQMIGSFINKTKTVIVKSTVPIGSTEKIGEWIHEASQGRFAVNMVMNPEFLREGSAVQDALNPDRIVIGSTNTAGLDDMKTIYKSWDCPIVQTTTRTAEMIKYSSNAFLATKISFMNEIARLCDQLQVNVRDVSKGVGLDHRIGSAFLHAGLGYGGSCFPKDVKELLWTADAYQNPLQILKEVETVNQTQPDYFLGKVREKYPSLAGKKVTLLGLAFKPDTDDTRESVSFPIMKQLTDEKAQVIVHDPIVQLSPSWLAQGVIQHSDPYEAVKGADVIIICTNWPQYEELDWKKVTGLVRHRFIFDGRNMLDAQEMKRLNFYYTGIGYS